MDKKITKEDIQEALDELSHRLPSITEYDNGLIAIDSGNHVTYTNSAGLEMFNKAMREEIEKYLSIKIKEKNKPRGKNYTKPKKRRK